MKNIGEKIGIWSLLLVCLLVCTKHVQAADEQWLNQKIEQATQEGNVYTVIQDGSGDYISVQEGVDAVDSGDTLIIYPGYYIENVEIMAKTVNLIGVDRDTCIIQYDTSDYCEVPLTLSAGRVCNLTICGAGNITDVSERRPVSREDELSAELGEYQWQNNYSGYAVHIDQNYLYGRELSFEHCTIKSFNSYCIGAGCRGNSKITFDECELLAAGVGGCIYLHDVEALEVGGRSDVVFRNSVMQSSLSPYIMTIHALEPHNAIYLTFQGVKVYAVAYEDGGGYNNINMNTGIGVEPWKIHRLSKQESVDYMARDMSVIPVLEEGVTYISTDEVAVNDFYTKKHVINVYNLDGISGNGWCGLNNTWLTSDSYGNTLTDMNSFIIPDNALID